MANSVLLKIGIENVSITLEQKALRECIQGTVLLYNLLLFSMQQWEIAV